MGLFDGGFDISQLADMLNPIGSAQAAPLPDTSAIGNVGGLTPEALLRSRGLGPDTPEMNPNPVPPGAVPMPRPNPLQPSPEELAGAVRLNPSAPPPVPDVGAALTGSAGAPPPGVGPTGPVPLGTSGATDMSSQSKTGDQRPSLAQALKGVQAPAAPVLQKISSPNAPRPTGAIKGGDLQALLMALNAGVPALAGRQLPVTLGGGRG